MEAPTNSTMPMSARKNRPGPAPVYASPDVGGVVAGGDVGVGVGATVVGVGDPPAVAMAMIGEVASLVGGTVDVIPSGAALFVYEVHVRASGLPETVKVNLAAEASVTSIGPPEAVNGPTMPAGLGRSRVSPVVGTGDGMGDVKEIDGGLIMAGVAPVALTVVVADPARSVLPRAADADTREAGTLTTVW